MQNKMLLITSLLVLGYTQAVLCTAALTVLTSANCGDQAVLTCTSTECNIAYTFFKDGITIFNLGGVYKPSYSNKYSLTLWSSSEVQVTIRNLELSDTGNYSCSCRFSSDSPPKPLQYHCKARTSSPSVTERKQLNITVDRLYPQPSIIDIALTGLTNQIQGMYSCWNSSTIASHFTCAWVSTASLPDRDYDYIITVTTGTTMATLSNSFRIATPSSPTIFNLVNINSRQVLRGIQDNLLTIKCVSSGGIPAPTLAWYIGNTNIYPLVESNASDYIQESDGTHTVTLTHSFTPSRSDDRTSFLCRLFYPGATTGASPDPKPASASLYLDLKPDSPTVSQTEQAVSGGNMTLRCISTNGRPAPNITWSYRGQIFIPTNTPSPDSTSETYTLISVLQRPVSAVDNGQPATCRVSHTTLSEHLSGIISVTVHFGPSNTRIYGNQATSAKENNQIRLNCTSGSSNPASNITWYNGSDVISNIKGYTRWPGDNNGVVTSNILTITPTRYMDGDRMKCETGNGFGNDSEYVDLDILYSPLIQLPTSITSVEGEQNILLTCSATSKPPATFTWYKGNTLLTHGTGTLTDNSFSYVIPRVNRTDAGSYRCDAGNIVGNSGLRDIHLYVKHAPTVNVSITDSPATYNVTCTAKGYPESYTYLDWVQIWPGYGPVATIPFTGKTLILTNVTYEISGVYVCAASNGVAVYDTNVTFTKGNASIVIKAAPVLTDLSTDGARVSVAGRLGQNATAEIKYWSNVNGSVVSCYKHAGGSLKHTPCYVTETATNVTLHVFHHTVTETGLLAIIKIPVNLTGDFADYDIVVSNNVQEDPVFGITIVPQGPPAAPIIMGNFSISPGEVIVTVVPGFHGGYNQTLVVQISTDLTTWLNNTAVHVGQDSRSKDIKLVNLHGSPLHYIRVFAYNIDGGSNLSSYLSFTPIEGMSFSPGQFSVALTAAVVVSVCVPVLIGITLFIMWRLRRGTRTKSRPKGTRNIATNSEHSDTVVECAMYVSAGVVESGPSTGDLYSKPQTTNKPQASPDVYAVVNKQKKDVYENAPTSFKNVDKKVNRNHMAAKRTVASGPKKNNINDGLIYAELELNNPEKCVIHGLDDATLYVQVDFTKSADPLPPDSDDETTDCRDVKKSY